jgi:DNA primase
MYSEATLMTLREAISIVDLVGEYVALKKSGTGYVGLCPFHGEKTPSFHVHPQKQCFHCFGCQKGGNIFTFIRAVEGLSFRDAVQRLAKRAGIELSESESPRREKVPPKAHERLKAALEWATKYFHYLLTEVPEYRFALDYLKARHVSEKTIERFRLGVSPKGWGTLMDLMRKRKFTLEEIVEAGLVVPKEGNQRGGYDRFRMRLMFPIRDIDGNPIGFGARLLTDEPNQPKYLNSPESPLFSKRQQFYGMFESQRQIRLRQEALIVEGYMDVVGLHEHDVTNVVATMGTALTEEHCKQLRPMANRAVTIFDPDQGGQDAWRRSVHLFMSGGIFAKDLSLPDNKDPDEFIVDEGAENFYRLCDKAPRQITKLLKEIAEKGPLSEEESGKLLSDLTPILVASRRLPDRALLWDDISLVLKISLPALKELSESTLGGMKPAPKKEEKIPSQRNSARSLSGAPPKPIEKSLDRLDRDFFQTCLRTPREFFSYPAERWQGGIKEPKIAQWLEKIHQAGPNDFEGQLTALLQEDEPALQAIAAACLVESKPAADLSLFKALADRIGGRKKELEIKALSAQVRLSARMGKGDEEVRLLERLKALRSS